MTSLINKLTRIVGDAFAAQGFDPALGVVKIADRPDLAQFQCNGAMIAAKAAKKNPREIAQAVANELHQQDMFAKLDRLAKIEIAGPGFINLSITDQWLSDYL